MPHFIQVAFPLDLATQLSDFLLFAQLDQKFQALLNGLFFGSVTGGFEGSGPKASYTESDDKMRAEVLKRLRQKGYGNLLDHKEGEQSVAGHPCTVATGPLMKACAWTKGRKWGLDTPNNIAPDASAEGASPYGSNMIKLWEKPANGGDGFYLTTQTFTIGKPLDPNVFEPPNSIISDRPKP